MSKAFDPRKILKQIDNSLLREFFARRGELGGVPWDDLTEHKIEPVFEAWQALPDASKNEVQLILRDIADLSDHRGRAVLAEEVLLRCPGRGAEFEAQQSKADNAMWVYLEIPEGFAEAALFARADSLPQSQWRKRNGLPMRAITADEAMCDALADELTAFYGPQQMRGRFCKVVHYRRSGGADYFFAYLDDYPDKRLVFDESSDQPVVRSDRGAFENVFVFTADEGAMEISAPGIGKSWEPMQKLFGRAILGEEIPPADPLRPSYRLDHLLRPDFPLPTMPEDRVEDARITRLRVLPRGSGGYIEIKADPRGGRFDIYRKIERFLRAENIPIEGTRVLQASFALKFIHEGRGRQPQMTFNITAPHSSDLRHKRDEHRVVAERCLKLWEVTDVA